MFNKQELKMAQVVGAVLQVFAVERQTTSMTVEGRKDVTRVTPDPTLSECHRCIRQPVADNSDGRDAT